jgi:hypothetical protein
MTIAILAVVLGVSWTKLATNFSPFGRCDVHWPHDCETELEPHINVPQVLDEGHRESQGKYWREIFLVVKRCKRQSFVH